MRGRLAVCLMALALAACNMPLSDVPLVPSAGGNALSMRSGNWLVVEECDSPMHRLMACIDHREAGAAQP